eukprot:1130228-Pleurochrysis_carterae.AAC.4
MQAENCSLDYDCKSRRARAEQKHAKSFIAYRVRDCALILFVCLHRASSFIALLVVVQASLPLHAHVWRAILARRAEVARGETIVGESDRVETVASDRVAVATAVATPLADFAYFSHRFEVEAAKVEHILEDI